MPCALDRGQFGAAAAIELSHALECSARRLGMPQQPQQLQQPQQPQQRGGP